MNKEITNYYIQHCKEQAGFHAEYAEKFVNADGQFRTSQHTVTSNSYF